MKPPGAIDAKRPGAFVSSDAGGTSNVNVGVTPAMLLRSRGLLALRSAKQLRQGGKARDRTHVLVLVVITTSHYTLENKHTPNYTRMLRTPYEQDPFFRVRACARATSAKGYSI